MFQYAKGCTIAAAMFALPTEGTAACSLSDLQRGLRLTDIAVTEISDGTVTFSGRITNNLTVPIGGFILHTIIEVQGRPRALYDGSASLNREISGGLLQGETMPFEEWVYIGDWGITAAAAVGEMDVTVKIEDAADADLRSLTGILAAQVGGWSESASVNDCRFTVE